MDLQHGGRKSCESLSYEDGNSSNDWSDGEFDDDADDIYDCPEQDESELAEREDGGDGYEEGDDFYDTPEDARQMLMQHEANARTDPPAVSRSDKPAIKDLKQSSENSPATMHKQLTQNSRNFDVAVNQDSNPDEASFETYDVPKSPVKKVSNGSSGGLPRPTPRPKPTVVTRPDASMNNNQPSFKKNAGNAIAGRWPPRPQTEEPEAAPETYDVPPPSPTSKHQNIINKLSRVINTNTPNIPVRESREIPTSQGSVKKPLRHNKPLPPPANNGCTPSKSVSPKQSPPVSPRRQSSDVPGEVDQESYEVPDRCNVNNVDRRKQEFTKPKPAAPPVGNKSSNMAPDRNVPVSNEVGGIDTCPPGQENYEVPQPQPQRPPDRPSLHGRNQNMTAAAPGRPAKPSRADKRFEEPERRSVPAPAAEESYEVPSSMMGTGVENYEVPRAEETRPKREPTKPSRPSKFGNVESASCVPNRPDGKPLRDTLKSHRNPTSPPFVERDASKIAQGQRGSLWGTKKQAPPPPVEPENYEVPAAAGQENYEVPSHEPDKPRREPLRPRESGRRAMPLPSPGSPPEMVPRDTAVGGHIASDHNRSFAAKGRGEPPPSVAQPENYEVPSSSALDRPVGKRHDLPLQLPKGGGCQVPERQVEETYEVADAPSAAPAARNLMQRGMPNPANARQRTSYTDVIIQPENYEEIDGSATAIPPRNTRPSTLGVPSRGSSRNANSQSLRNPPPIATSPKPEVSPPVEQETYEVVDKPDEQENYECVDQPTEAKTPIAAAPFGAVMQELNRRNSGKGNPSQDRGNRCPPEGREKPKAPQPSPMDQILNNVISGLECPVSNSALQKPPRTSKPEPPSPNHSRPGSIRQVPPRPGSTQEVSQDGPLLDITELNAADKSPCDPSPRVPGRGARPAVPLPAVPQERTPEEILKEQPWFKGDMDRKEAENILKRKGRNGGFIVRNTTKIDGYSISIYYQGSIRHLHIPRKNNKFHLGTSEQSFDSVVELVNYFMKNKIDLKAGGTTELVSVM